MRFLLRQGSHNRNQDLALVIHCVDGKSADGLGDDHIDVSGLSVVNHTVKVLTLFCVGAGNTIIKVEPCKVNKGVIRL